VSFKVPKHGAIPESTHLNFYDQNLSVVIQENTCVIRHPEPTEKLTGHMAATIDYKLEKQHGNLDVDEGEYALSDLSLLRGILHINTEFINRVNIKTTYHVLLKNSVMVNHSLVSILT
jgi:hypothetical protein